MKNDTDRIRIAIQKSGRLHEASYRLLKDCGIDVTRYKDALFCSSDNFELDILWVRDDDIPKFVLDGVCDFGIVGTNVLTEQTLQRLQNGYQNPIKTVRFLDFAQCRLALAVPEWLPYQSAICLEGMRIATSYPYLLTEFLNENKVNAQVVTLTGSVEIACRLGIADAICDLVSTGATLEANNLREAELVFESQAVLIQSSNPLSEPKQQIARIFHNQMAGVPALAIENMMVLRSRSC